MKIKDINLGANGTNPLTNDNVFVKNEVLSLQQLTGLPTRKGLESAVISEGKIVSVVSNGYGHLPNEKFFYAVESKLINADINYVTRSINRGNRSFAVDYILADQRFVVNFKNSTDELYPMLRFVNSYDGSCKTSGSFGFFRKVCFNGLHIAHTKIGFSIKHKGDICEVVMPEINTLVKTFMDNEFYEIRRKFEVLAERPIKNIAKFVKVQADHFKLFQFESSEKNPAPSLNARTVIETAPNMWIGYNAFNELLHGKLKKTFTQQAEIDSRIFEEFSAQYQ
jgi:hypothetical protein